MIGNEFFRETATFFQKVIKDTCKNVLALKYAQHADIKSSFSIQA